MIQNVLQQKLRPLIEAERTLRRRKAVAWILWSGAVALAILLALAVHFQWWSWMVLIVVFGIVSIATLIGVWWADSRTVGVKALAERIENAHPDLRAALITAVEQEAGKDGKLGYLQERVVYEAVNHALEHDWIRRVSRKRLIGAAWFQALAGIAFGALLWMVLGEARPIGRERDVVADVPEPVAPEPAPADYEIEVLPGDTEVERGERLIIEARFGERLPPEAMLVMRDPGEEGAERGRVPMKAGLDESVFSGLIAAVDSDLVYRIEFDGETSEEFSIATYIHPELEQADAEITPPAYTEQEAKKIKNVRKVSLLEGSDLAWSMKVNKPVAAAELFGEDESVIALTPSSEDPTVLVASHRPEETLKYRLHLVDEKDRANKRPPWFSVTVKRNLPPKLDFTFPKRDVEVSAIQELPVEAKVWDDLGVLKAGATFTYGDESRDVELADSRLEGGEDHVVRTLFTLEDIGASPRDLVAYHLWAEDLGPDGQPRRTSSDMFFAEVRYFEDIFRESENMGGQGQPGEQGQSEQLLKLQKDVMNATWKLLRRADMGRTFEDIGSDIGVVKESQEHALGQAMEAAEKAEDAEVKALISTAAEHMGQAVETLGKGVDFQEVKQLRPAHEAERKAYEALVRARSREHDVTRSQSQSSGQGQQQQQQLMQLEMKQKELKYEEEREAKDPQEQAQQQAELEFLNRLQELARRQEAIAEKIKELENALEEAKTEEEKQELERQLKRLQEEQEQLLRDLDELSENMDSEENRANMAEERERLEETREDVQEASEKLDEGKLADAANAATRAQRELEETKEDFRKKTSRRFDQEMRDLRQKARELADNQEAIGEKLEESGRPGENENPFDSESRSPLANAELARELEQQRKALGEMLEQMRELSENSEESEPILSSALYDAVREARMGGIEESLEEARDLTRYDRREVAQESERAAARGLEELKNDVEKAAEKVLGSEADALRLARSELEDLIEQSREEAERLGGQAGEEGAEREGTDLAMNEAGREPRPGETREGQATDPTGSDPTQQGKPDGPTGSEAGEMDGSQSEPRSRRRVILPSQSGEGSQETRAGDDEGEPREGQEGKAGEEGRQEQQPGEGKGEGEGAESPENREQQLAENGRGQQPGQGRGEGEGREPSDQPGQGQGEGQPGEQPGQGQEGQGQSQGQMAESGQGQQPGQGQGQSEGEGQGQGQGASPGEGQGQDGQQSGERRGYRGGFAEAGQQRSGGSPSVGGADRSGRVGPNFGGPSDQRDGGVPSGSGDVDASQQPLFFQGANEAPEPEGPITGRDYEEWAGRLRNLENMVEQDDLRNELAKVMDEARAMRIEFRRNNAPPQAKTIDQRITMPLVEIRDRVAEELAKLDKENPLAPIDRDPVPREYRELVRRYYEELGSGR